MDCMPTDMCSYVLDGLQEAQEVPLSEWLNTILHVDTTTFGDWKTAISDQKWFKDPEIAAALADYCRAGCDSQRCEPFATLCSRIIELGRGNIPGIPIQHSYPLDDLCFLAHAFLHAPMQGCAVVATCKRILESLAAGSLEWGHILHWWEMRFVRPLVEQMSALDLDTGLPKSVRKPHQQSTTTYELRKRLPRKCARDARNPATMGHALGASCPPQDDGAERLATDNLRSGLAAARGAGSAEIRGDTHAAVQSRLYALEVLSSTHGTRIHCLGNIVKDDKVYPWFYDAGGVVYTAEFVSIVEDFEKFAAMIIALARCTPEQLGYMPSCILQPPVGRANDGPLPFKLDLVGYSVDILDSKTNTTHRVVLKEYASSHDTFFGSRAVVYTASAPLTNNNVSVKLSYQAPVAVSEQQIVALARANGVKNLPRIHLCRDLWKLSDGVRRTLFLEKIGEPTGFEDRILRASVYTQYQNLQNLFNTRPDLIPIMTNQLLDCIHDLRYKANILHRNINVDSIMFEMRGSAYHFILMDYDMGVVLPQNPNANCAPSLQYPAGALPFMARDLVRAAWPTATRRTRPDAVGQHCMHYLWYEYESVYWTSLHCALVLPTKGLTGAELEICRGNYKSLQEGPPKAINATKNSIAMYGLHWNDIELFSTAACLEGWFLAWTALFKAAAGARNAHDAGQSGEWWDEETCGGTLSRDVIKAGLTPYMPCQQL